MGTQAILTHYNPAHGGADISTYAQEKRVLDPERDYTPFKCSPLQLMTQIVDLQVRAKSSGLRLLLGQFLRLSAHLKKLRLAESRPFTHYWTCRFPR